MKYLLDTNICIYIIKEKPDWVVRKFQQFAIGDIGISSITVAELEYGVQKSRWSERNQQALHQFLRPLEMVSFNEQDAVVYGNIRASLEAEGTPIGALDLLIVAQAVRLGVAVVTNNEREFGRVSQLIVENWV